MRLTMIVFSCFTPTRHVTPIIAFCIGRQMTSCHYGEYLSVTLHHRSAMNKANKVRLLMENIFQDGHGSPQMEDAAAQLGTREYTLRRQLKAEGHSFQQLRKDTRRDMAIYHLERKQDSVEEVAFKLAFSDSSAFIRAFKAWMGITPLAYRKLSDDAVGAPAMQGKKYT